MPIRTSIPIKIFDQESFHRVERRVTGIAFEIHNEFGRYLDERLYQRELTRRLRDAGFDVEQELPMVVSLDDFRKDSPEIRRQFTLIDHEWEPMSAECNRMHQLMLRLLNEWGAFLDPILYRDALTHFLGGSQIIREVPVRSEGTQIGTQTMHLLTDDIAFSLTTSTHRPKAVFEHQQRFLRHTPLRAIQWINLNHHDIEFRTIER